MKVLVFLSCMPNELPCWGYSAHVAVGCIGLEPAGGHEPTGMTLSGMQRPSSPNPQGNSKRPGTC